MDSPLVDRAIKSALNQDWHEAIALNLTLLSQDEANVEALNRLAFAYLKSGSLAHAKNTYKKVLKLDKYNPIALKNLSWLTQVTRSDIHRNDSISPTPTVFLEEPGKTKMVNLVHLAPNRVLCNLMTSQKVELTPKKHSIEIRDEKGTYIGALPDDIAHRLLRFIAAGTTYDVYIKNVAKNSMTVFIRELKRSKKFAHIPSFSIVNSNQPKSTETKNVSIKGEEEVESQD